MTDRPTHILSQQALSEADALLQEEFANEVEPLQNRRQRVRVSQDGVERRQFSSNYSHLTPAGAELGKAIDRYKIAHHRRYITFDEILLVLESLGYSRTLNNSTPLPTPAVGVEVPVSSALQST